MRAGQPFDLDISISGEPPPSVEWKLKGYLFKNVLLSDSCNDVADAEVETSDRIHISNPEYRTKFICKRSLRSDTGTYKLRAYNDYGEDVADVIVTVLDRPGEPQGPLTPENIHAQGARFEQRLIEKRI